jgi:hypothetical protein
MPEEEKDQRETHLLIYLLQPISRREVQRMFLSSMACQRSPFLPQADIRSSRSQRQFRLNPRSLMTRITLLVNVNTPNIQKLLNICSSTKKYGMDYIFLELSWGCRLHFLTFHIPISPKAQQGPGAPVIKSKAVMERK